MEAESTPESVIRSDDALWVMCLGSFLTITDLMRTRRTCSAFRDIVHRYLKDSSKRKIACSDEELAAMTRINAYPTQIQLESAKITLQGIQGLVSSGRLDDVKIVDCDHVNDQAIIALANGSRGLKKIEIDCRPLALAQRNGYNGMRPMTITDQAIRTVATACGGLEVLSLIWVRQVTDDAFLEIFGRCVRLSVLKLHWSRISDKALQSIGPKEYFRELDVRACKEVTDAGVQPLVQQCLHLRVLSLIDVQCTDETLKELARTGRAAQLETLALSDIEAITDAGLIALSEGVSENLKTLHLSHLKGVTNEGVSKLLVAASGLVDLTISYVSVTDEAMQRLTTHPTTLPKLKVARFDGLKELTDVGLTNFVKACSKLSIMECFNSRTTEACVKSLCNPALNVIMYAW
jgi:hypothetical protein